jgi:uncharacterized protein YcbX
MARVEALFIYPLKSARAIALDSARLGATGFEWDRHWMASDDNGTFFSQRTHPKLALIQPKLDGVAVQGLASPAASVTTLTLEREGLQPLRQSTQPAGEPRPVRVWDDRFPSLDQGDEASEWLSQALGTKARLIRLMPRAQRHADPDFAGDTTAPVSFTDAFPFLVVNRASLESLNERMPEPVPMNRFRPNIVLGGLEPWAEDRIESISIGAVRLRLVKPCTRCVITSTDQLTGEIKENPLPVLRAFRFSKELRGVMFGENAVIESGIAESIARGDECQVRFEA